MNHSFRFLLSITALLLALAGGAVNAQNIVLRDAPELKFEKPTDCNSPAHWDGDTYYIFNSWGGPNLTTGRDQFSLTETLESKYDNSRHGGRWIECTWKADDGVLYGWYHFEPYGLCAEANWLTAPKIGAVRSIDNGQHWTDLGIVLEARPGLECTAKNGFFAGGNGDFSAMLDHDKKYLYIFFSAYTGHVTEQGVAVARMAWKDRDKPVGKVWKWHERDWKQPGIGGDLTPIFPALVNWKRSNSVAFWGPSIHWNTHLKQYVVLLNRTAGRPGWPQEGIYVTYSRTLDNPQSWSQPKKIVEGGEWYPQVLGVNREARETDKLCGKQARFYVNGKSNKEILFFREGEDTSALPPVHSKMKAS